MLITAFCLIALVLICSGLGWATHLIHNEDY